MDDIAIRAARAEAAAYREMARNAGAAFNAGFEEHDGAISVWSPDHDAAYSPVFLLAASADPAATLRLFEESAQSRGQAIIGINTDPALDAWISAQGGPEALGYEMNCAEYFWIIELDAEMRSPELSPGIEMLRPTPEQAETYAETFNCGFGLTPDHLRGHMFAASIEKPGWRHYIYTADGEPAGVSALYIADEAGVFFVTSVRKEYRGRGIQSAATRQRLRDSQEAGSDLVTVATVTDNASPRNMERAGFRRLYTRYSLQKQLAPQPELIEVGGRKLGAMPGVA